MPKPLSIAYKAALAAGSYLQATCVKITLRDSTVVAFTTWSDFLNFLGVIYDPNELVSIEPVSGSVGTGVVSFTITGLIGAYVAALGQALSADDARFLFTGAKMVFFNVLPLNLSAGMEMIASGEVGEVRILSETSFSIEFRSNMQRAAIQYGLFITQNCHKDLGVQNFNGTGCPATLIHHTVTVSAVSGDGLSISFTLTPTRTLVNGTLVGASGGNSQVPPQRIKSYTLVAGVVTAVLADSLPFGVLVGDSLVVTEGCRKDSSVHEGGITDCTFYNGSDFPAGYSPDVPGVDRLSTAGS